MKKINVNISKEELNDLYIVQNLSRKDLAKKLNISESKLKSLLKNYNIEKNINKRVELTKKTNLEKYGKTCNLQIDEIKDKRNKVKRYGFVFNNLDNNTQYIEDENTTEKLKCLICGKEFNYRLSPHIISKHNMSTQEYKSLFGKDIKITSDSFIKRKANLSKGRKQSQETRTKISKSKKGTTAWNKGLTRETDLRVEKYSKSKEGKKRTLEQRIRISERTKEGMNNPIVKNKISKANRLRVYTKEQKEKRSLISRNLWKNPNYANKCSNPKYGNKPVYNGIRFMSDTEMLFAKKLDELNIKYKYQAGPFKYLKRRDNKYHNYYPDFYLLEYDLYLEIKYRKNYLYGLDDVLEDKLEGMKQLNLKCIVLDRRDLKDLDIIILNIA